MKHFIIKNKLLSIKNDKGQFTIFALICWFPGTQKPILEIQVTSKVNGGGGGLTPPIIYLDTWISNIDILYTGNQRINANMVNSLRYTGTVLGCLVLSWGVLWCPVVFCGVLW